MGLPAASMRVACSSWGGQRVWMGWRGAGQDCWSGLLPGQDTAGSAVRMLWAVSQPFPGTPLCSGGLSQALCRCDRCPSLEDMAVQSVCGCKQGKGNNMRRLGCPDFLFFFVHYCSICGTDPASGCSLTHCLDWK